MDITIPGYTLGKQLGRGGMSLVYLAHQQNMDRPVAIKIFTPTLVSEQEFVQRFLQEAKTVATLNHAHIIPVYDVGQVDQHYYIVMEYLPGLTLSHWIHVGLEPLEVLEIIQQVASALYYSHRKGIVHRDIKPENIMFREDNSAVLMDFGIASSGAIDENLTLDGQMIGTPAYMSPEQAKGKQVDHRSDLYSLGVVLYEMLVKKPPFIADDEIAVALMQVTEAVPVLPEKNKSFQVLLNRLMAKDVEDRFQNGLELGKVAKQLSELLTGKNKTIEGRVMKNHEPQALALQDIDSTDEQQRSSSLPSKNFQVEITSMRKAIVFRRYSICIKIVSDDVAQLNVQMSQVMDRLLDWYAEYDSKAKVVELQFYCKPWLLEPIEKSIEKMREAEDVYGFLQKTDFSLSVFDLSGVNMVQRVNF
ncbi:MAG: serine/threonine protein kinase [Pseudomonadales bacterium]|nr:serine/threonine protein kinase [Pseudomonadales bacterium]